MPPVAQGRTDMAHQCGQLCSAAHEVSTAPTHLLVYNLHIKLGQLYVSLFTDRFKHLNTLSLPHW